MPKPPTTWKGVESRVAAAVGSKRRPLSGGNSQTGRDDAMHDHLFIETKHRNKFSVCTLYYQTRTLALREGKIPVVALHEKGRHGALVLLHLDDVPRLAEFMKPQKSWKPAFPKQASVCKPSASQKPSSTKNTKGSGRTANSVRSQKTANK